MHRMAPNNKSGRENHTHEYGLSQEDEPISLGYHPVACTRAVVVG